MEKNIFVNNLKCPLTKLFFCEPVLADDGHFYEFMAIKNHLSKNTISPTTGNKMGHMIVKAPVIKKMLDEFMELYPEYRNEQFSFKKPFYMFQTDFFDYLKKREYVKLKEFTSIVLNTEIHIEGENGSETVFEIICKNCHDSEILQYIIDNAVDIDVYDKKKFKPIHSICKHASGDILMYFMSKLKKSELECEDSDGDSPLHYILAYRKPDEYVKFLGEYLKMGINVNVTNKIGMWPIHSVINSGDIDGLRLLLDYGQNLNVINKYVGGLNLLQYAFKYSGTVEMIQYIIDLNLELGVDLDPNTTCEQLIYDNKSINKRSKQKMVLHYLSKLLSKAIVIDNFIDIVNRDVNRDVNRQSPVMPPGL
jgi:hypothetical protein